MRSIAEPTFIFIAFVSVWVSKGIYTASHMPVQAICQNLALGKSNTFSSSLGCCFWSSAAGQELSGTGETLKLLLQDAGSCDKTDLRSPNLSPLVFDLLLFYILHLLCCKAAVVKFQVKSYPYLKVSQYRSTCTAFMVGRKKAGKME